ncbi:rho guanyl-nucleotide exchange factor 1 [Actinidia rufa]|uniref:Rho guanyl-nucleotide exchange factor 1 n=1 Tax=Actinidia rufa TaxID=165716 RepID=A0A7J0EIB0_9ERIC|nr:rho guanyl-nucleotide exchange factor 1 [Actinidia rufa]
MRSVSSEDGSDQLCGRYSKSVDVSESESSSSIPSRPLARRLENVKSCFPSLPVMLPLIGGKAVVVWDEKTEKEETDLSEIDLMKKRVAKFLLGEDMFGGVTVFWELWRLEPFALQTKAMWRTEMVWLLCMRDSIVELVPSIQQFPGGGTYKVMASRPRSDLYMNLPALKKLDAMLVSILDWFQDMEFGYVDRGIVVADANDGKVYPSAATSGRPSIRQAEKWLPCPKVPPKGLSEDARKKLQ